MEQIVLKPEVLGYLGPLPLTNTLFVSWIIIAMLLIISLIVRLKVQLVPGGFQNLMELVVEAGFNQVESLAGSKTAVFSQLS